MGSSPASSGGAAASVPIHRYWPRRFSVIGLCFLSTFICYLDRVNMSVAIIPMAEEFGWSQTTRGVVLSSFFYGYLVTQIVGGWLADRFGAKTVLGLGVIWWSLFTLVTPPAAALSFGVLFVARVMMGAGEGVNFPAIISMFARWVPQEREVAGGGASTSLRFPLGTVCALLFTPMIIDAWGWPAVFYIFGALGFVWWLAWAIASTARRTRIPRSPRRNGHSFARARWWYRRRRFRGVCCSRRPPSGRSSTTTSATTGASTSS